MAMSLFTQAYEKARDVFTTQTFSSGDPDWNKILNNDVSVKSLLGPTGPSPAQAPGLEKLRAEIKSGRGGMFKRIFRLEGDVIWDAAKGDGKTGSRAERAAALKFLRHLYRTSKRGSQDVWIYNPVKSYSAYVFDEVKGDVTKSKRALNKTKEMFSSSQMKHMSDALQIALASSQKAMASVNGGSETMKSCVRDWFCADKASDVELNNALAVLKAGLPKIVDGLNSNSLVFTDYLDWRKTRGSIFGGAVPGGEGGGFPVIYIEGAFTKLAGNSGKMWLCAETIVHEMSHYKLSTADHRYDHAGLAPSSNSFTPAQALTNADSWGYFVMDIDGKLSASDKKKTLGLTS